MSVHLCSRPEEFILVIRSVGSFIHSFCWSRVSSAVSTALGPCESQMNKTVSAQKKLAAVGGGESRVPRISAWCGERHRQDTGEEKEERERPHARESTKKCKT